jgi:hypothetical protein
LFSCAASVVISGMAIEPLLFCSRRSAPQARLVQKPVNFDWLQGYVRLVLANARSGADLLANLIQT